MTTNNNEVKAVEAKESEMNNVEAKESEMNTNKEKKDEVNNVEATSTETTEVKTEENETTRPQGSCDKFGHISKKSADCKVCAAKGACLNASGQLKDDKSSNKGEEHKRAGGKGSERKDFLKSLIEQTLYTRAQIIEKYLSKYPEAAKSTVMTYLSDAKNEKTIKEGRAWDRLVVEDKKTHILRFTGKVIAIPTKERKAA